MRTLVVLPTYEEAENIAEVLRRLHAAAPSVDILVVDDSSPDGTADIAKAAAHELGHGLDADHDGDHAGGRVDVTIRPGKNGLGSAYRDGFREGLALGYDVLVEMDSDLSHDPSALPDLLREVENGADLAIGSRYVPGGSIPNWPIHRRSLSRWGNRYSAFMLRMTVRDSTSGYRAYSAEALRRIELDAVRADGYGFQIEMAYRVARMGGRIAEVPIEFRDRIRGHSKMSSRIIGEALALVSWWGIRDRALSVPAFLRRRRRLV